MNRFQQEIYKTIDILVEQKITKLNFDRTQRGKVVAIEDNIGIVEINGDNYNCKINAGMNIQPDDIVYVKYPQNNDSDRYIDSKLGDNYASDMYNLDGGKPYTNYGGIDAIVGGGVVGS